MPQPVMDFELIAKNPKKLKAFYTNLFAWRPEDYPGMDYALLHADAKSGINGGIGSEATGLSVGMTIYVQVDDVEKFLEKARKLGAGKVLQEPNDIEGVGRFAVFQDPEGNRIGLWRLPKAGRTAINEESNDTI